MQAHIETQRLILRPIEKGDLLGIFELDSDKEVHKFLGNNPIKSLQESNSIIEYILNQYEEYGIGRCAVIDKETHEFIGWSGLKYETEVRSEMNYYDLGYRLRKKFWGRGIATETAFASLEYGFNTMHLSEIYAGAHIENIASNKVIEKVGMKFLEEFIYEGEPHNWYKITQHEWRENQSTNK